MLETGLEHVTHLAVVVSNPRSLKLLGAKFVEIADVIGEDNTCCLLEMFAGKTLEFPSGVEISRAHQKLHVWQLKRWGKTDEEIAKKTGISIADVPMLVQGMDALLD